MSDDIAQELRDLIDRINLRLSNAASEGYRVELDVRSFKEEQFGRFNRVNHQQISIEIYKAV